MASTKAALKAVGERNQGVEVRARDGAQRDDQHHKHSSCRNAVREQRNGSIPSCKTFAHDSRAHDSREQERSTEELRSNSVRDAHVALDELG